MRNVLSALRTIHAKINLIFLAVLLFVVDVARPADAQGFVRWDCLHWM